MGDRAQIAVAQYDDDLVWLYSHWGGAETYRDLAKALDRGRDRWRDPEYLTRIIFCELARDNIEGTTGLGIGLHKHGDIEHPIPVVDGRAQLVQFISEESDEKIGEPLDFEDFIAKYNVE